MSGRIRMSEADEIQDGERGQNPAVVEPERRDHSAPPAQEAENREPDQGDANRDEAPEKSGKPGESQETPESFNRRIRTLTWEREEAKRRADRVQAEFDEWLRRARAQGDPNAAAIAEARRQIEAENAEKAKQRKRAEYDEACAVTYRRGKAEFEDFDTDVQALNAMGLDPNAEDKQDFVDFIAHSPEGHKIYHRLAQEPERTRELLGKSRGEIFRTLTRMEAELTAPPAQPNGLARRPVPAPIRPISGRSSRTYGANNMDMDTGDWIRERDKSEWENRRR